MTAGPQAVLAGTAEDPLAVLRSRRYAGLLIGAALLGVPVSAAAYGFLALVGELEPTVYEDLPRSLGFDTTPGWWPLPLLVTAGLIVGLSIRLLPGRGGHEPTGGLATGGPPPPAELPGIALAAFGTLAFGAVLGPEAPLLALGAGLAAGAAHLGRRPGPAGAPPELYTMLGAAGGFAAVSSLLGSPLLGAFLLMEAIGLGGPMLGLVLVPGLLAAGIGSLVFIGLGEWTGLGTFSLALRDVPAASTPTLAEFGWAIAIGAAAAVLGGGVRWLALWLKGHVTSHTVAAPVILGLVVAGAAIVYAQVTGKQARDVMYSGETALGPLLGTSASYSAGALVMLMACKGLAYAASLGGFRGGPVFPSMFIGAVGGIALSHLPGLTLVGGFAMGVGAMCVTMLRLPLTSVLLATLLLGSEGLKVMPLVIVATVVAYVVSAVLAPATGSATDRQEGPAGGGAAEAGTGGGGSGGAGEDGPGHPGTGGGGAARGGAGRSGT